MTDSSRHYAEILVSHSLMCQMLVRGSANAKKMAYAIDKKPDAIAVCDLVHWLKTFALHCDAAIEAIANRN